MPVFGDPAGTPSSTTLPIPPNNTMTVYDNGSGPPAGTPRATGITIRLVPNISCPTHDAENVLNFSHIALVPATTDIRDNKSDAYTPGNGDIVYVPDATGTPYKVIHVEMRARGTAAEHKKVYLDRGTPPWPTNHL